MELLHRAELPIDLTNGNDGRGSKWFSSAKLRNLIEGQLRLLGQVRQPFAVPVVLHVTRVLGPRQKKWDVSSGFRGNWKELEDALVVLGWFVDDGPDYITGIYFKQVAPKKRTCPKTIVEVFQSEEAEGG